MKEQPEPNVLPIPMDDRILTKCNRILNDSLERHSKVFVMRMDIHFPNDEMAQEKIKTFNQRLREKWKNAGYDPAYVAAREMGSKEGIHYHEAWFLNGQKTWKTYERFKEAEAVHQRVIGSEYDATGLIDYCDKGHRNGIMVKRDDPDPTNFQEAQRQVSYLAKKDQKENVRGKTFFSSRPKGRNKKENE